MSTRAYIGIVKEVEGEYAVKYVYLHNNGGIESCGEILRDHYDTIELVEALIELGDLSVLCENLYPKNGAIHTYDEPQPDVCLFYHRDRNLYWKNVAPMVIKGFEKHRVVAEYLRGRSEYMYLFDADEQKWTVDGV